MSSPAELKPLLARLAELIQAHTPHDGIFELRVPGVYVFRRSHKPKELMHGVHRATLCMVAQGAKRVFLGQDSYDYDGTRMLVSSVDVPVSGQVLQASPEKPYLGLAMDLDAQRISELALKVFPHGLPPPRKEGAFSLCEMDAGLLGATIRMMELLAQPDEADLIAPLVVEEILIRLLRGPAGAMVAQIGQEVSKVKQVSKAIAWVQQHFDQTLDVERLATMVHMSASSFHHHFKTVTSMSPLQYQKALRLQEARRLMLSKMMDAGTASRQVGYASASQFSREYGRYFGHAPTKDIARLREGGQIAFEGVEAS